MFSDFLNFISSSFYNLLIHAIDKLPDINFSIPDNAFAGLEYIFSGVAYFLPVKALLPIVLVDFSISSFHIVWSIILRIKSFIPTMGA